ncbi:LAFE_0D03180g1_1 [Lachancea fermentati]|uniref:LAFE_0D03180g1_1 n=1 Tax=Lachancea fermentati TaxID=4955 RepID=A0A1G4MBD3_LACFM|nr:LAFE_0D03180g1_1 [Lachancea fermentati]
MPATLDLREELTFYKRYHKQRANVIIHMIFVPTILYSGMVILHQVKLYKGYTLTHFLAVLFVMYYVALSRRVGSLLSCILVATLHGIDTGSLSVSPRTAYMLFVLGWIFQFIGHGYFEGRKPALLDSFVQSLVTAPLFILFEVLFHLGFYPDLNAELQRRIDGEKKPGL